MLLWLGPLFSTLPRATLAAIIMVAMKGTLLKIGDVRRFAREGKVELMVWMVAFTTCVVIDIDVGLFAGLLVSLFALYLKGWKSYSCLLGQVPGTEIYIDVKTHRAVAQIPFTRIFHYCGSINFASRASFKKDLYKAIGFKANAFEEQIRTVIIDLLAVAHLDHSGCKSLEEINDDIKHCGAELFLVSASDNLFNSLSHAQQLGGAALESFTTVHDAVLYSQRTSSSERNSATS